MSKCTITGKTSGMSPRDYAYIYSTISFSATGKLSCDKSQRPVVLLQAMINL